MIQPPLHSLLLQQLGSLDSASLWLLILVLFQGQHGADRRCWGDHAIYFAEDSARLCKGGSQTAHSVCYRWDAYVMCLAGMGWAGVPHMWPGGRGLPTIWGRLPPWCFGAGRGGCVCSEGHHGLCMWQGQS